jgi:hypothetical protein
LALNEMMVAFARLVREWDFVPGERFSEKKWREEIKDFHMVRVGDLWGRFMPTRN